jgi:hypothetical protein
MEQSSWEASSLSEVIINPIVEAEGSVPCSQEPATESYPEPDESISYLGPRSDMFW